MSTYEHDLLTARFAALAPKALPGDWDDVLGRSGAVRPRRGRPARSFWRGGRRRKLVVALAVAVLVPAVAAAAYGTVRILILDRGFIGLPPVGATPSAPESGELVLRWRGRSAVHSFTIPNRGLAMPFVNVFVYADGRVIWHREGHVPEGANELTSGYLEQRLTSDGVDLLRSELVATGLFDRNLKLVLPRMTEDTPVPRTEIGEPVSCWEADVRRGDRLVRLRCVPSYASPSLRGNVTPEQLSALPRVDALLTDTASALPPSAWAVRKVRAFVPSHFAVCLATSPPLTDAPRRILSLLPARAEELLRDRSWTGYKVSGRTVAYCSKVATDDAREIANAVSGLERHPWAESLIYDVVKGAKDWEETTISFDPYLPHDEFLLYDGGR
ncbi:MAG TPA: hypothetical protein VFT86_04115 [Gaiellaceae bacterium]|nr:hypothetical protein [Gaiellaceae bacterium]